jgi:hypothetical protein
MTWPAFNANLGPARAFAMAQALLPGQDPTRRIVVIPAAVAGQALAGGTLRSPSGTYFPGAKAALAAALAAFPGALALLSWTQGEQDGNNGTGAASYIAAFETMLADLRSVPGAAGMLAVIHQMQPGRFIPEPVELPARAVIDGAHKAIPLSVPGCIFIGADLGDGVPGDPSHFASAAHRKAGQRAAAALARAAAFTEAPPPVPAAPAAGAGRQVAITVTSPPAPAYVIEYRAAGSAGAWTAQVACPAVWTAAGASFLATVGGTGSVEVRLRTRSYGGDSAASAAITLPLWSIAAGDGAATISSAPPAPAAPTVVAGDSGATVE